MIIGDICNRDVITIDKGASIRAAAHCMRDRRVGELIVTEGRASHRVPIGTLTDRDIVIEILAEDADVSNLCVADIMNYELLIAHEEDDIVDTLKAMRGKTLRCIPVVSRGGKLIGNVALDTLTEHIAMQLTALATLLRQPDA